jgi:tetratricopeptide (TPR) repeat protein
MRRYISLVVLFLMAVIVMGCSKSPEEKKQAYLESAQQYMEKEKYAEAAIQYQNVLQITPDDVKTLISLGEVQLKLNRPQQAYAAFSKASQADPKNVKAREYLASMLLLAKKYDLVEKQASTILKDDPKNLLAKEILAQALFMNGKKEQGIKLMEELLKTQSPTEDMYINTIQMYMAMGRMEDTLALVSKGSSLFPKSAKIRFLASDISVFRNDINSAKKWAEEAYRVSGDNVNAGIALAMFYTRHNMEDLYRVQLAELKKRFPQSPDPLILESTILHQKHDLDGSLKAARRALELKDTTQTRTLISQILLDKKDTAQAKKMLTETVEKDSKAMLPRLLLAQIYLDEKNSTKAIELLDEPLKLAPGSPDLASTAAQAYLMKGDVMKARQIVEGALKENTQNIALHRMMAKIHFVQGEYKKALLETDLLVKNSVKTPDILYIGALSALRSGDVQNAATYIQSLKASVPNDWITLHAEILHLLAQKDIKGAYQIADKALTLYPNNDDALALYGYTAPKTVGWQTAITKVGSACSKVNSANCHMILSALLEGSGKKDEALSEIKKAIEREPDKSMLYHALAQFYARHNMIKDALDEYEKILNKSPEDLRAATMLALLNQSSGDIDAAKKVYKYILDKDPKNGLAANNLAWILAEGDKKKDLDEALKLAQTAKDAYPDDPRIADTLGYIYLKKGLPENALGQFQMASEKLQDDPTILYHLALALVDLKKGADAVPYLKKSLGSSQQFTDRQQAQTLLAELQSGKKK